MWTNRYDRVLEDVLDIWRSATVHAADLFRMPDVVGTIRANACVNLLVDARVTRYP